MENWKSYPIRPYFQSKLLAGTLQSRTSNFYYTSMINETSLSTTTEGVFLMQITNTIVKYIDSTR